VKKETGKILVKYLINFGIAALITVAVFAIHGFFTDDLANNILVLADGFSISGLLLVLFAGMIFVTSKGALIGISFIVRNAVLALFVPMGRARQELYKDYRERKIKDVKKFADFSMLIIGLVYLVVGIVFNVIWYTNFYSIPG